LHHQPDEGEENAREVIDEMEDVPFEHPYMIRVHQERRADHDGHPDEEPCDI
jgi:hypothetical protein